MKTNMSGERARKHGIRMKNGKREMARCPVRNGKPERAGGPAARILRCKV